MSGTRTRAAFCQSEVLFSASQFLALKNPLTLPEQDIQYLKLNGCFHLPTRPVQDEFIHQYFLYIHPCYPLIDEAEFWDLYLNRYHHHGSRRTMSLLVFQAMLFASSAFVSSAVLKNAGYSGVKVARGIFHRRAKLLFDLGVESDAFTKSQAALLLTFQFSAAEPHTGSLWLSTAIQNAIVAQAHTFQAPGLSPATKRRNKRLWWSLYWRDRVLSLGLRKPLQITPSSFNVKIDTITQEDLRGESHESVVYDPKTKKHLATILNYQCRLGIVLTEVLAIAYGPSGFDPTYCLDNLGTTVSRIRTARSRLTQWKEEAEAVFCVFMIDSNAHRFLTLFSSLLYIYVHAGQIALGNHEGMVIERLQKGVTVLDDTRLRDIGEELTHATTETTRLVRHIVRQGLTQHLPISVIAYIAYPLMLSSLDDKLSSMRTEAETDQTVSQCHAQVMHLCSKRFEGAEDISRMITQILHSVPIRLPERVFESRANSKIPGANNMPRARWDELFVTRIYLRLRLSLDFALVTGKPPKETDLPSYILYADSKKLTWGPVHTMSSTMPAPSYGESTFEDPMTQDPDGDTRVIELDEDAEIDDPGSTLQDQVMDEQSIFQGLQTGDAGRLLRNSWEYDTIWAANLFEEMTDVLQG